MEYFGGVEKAIREFVLVKVVLVHALMDHEALHASTYA